MGDSDVLGLVIPPAGPVFMVALGVHVTSGLACVAAGAGAALSTKGVGRHARFGRAYVGGMGLLFASMLVMAVVRWPLDVHLMVIGCVAAAAAAVGLAGRRRAHRDGVHAAAMGCSYVALLTGFYVDNGPSLPLWDRLPGWSYWAAPSLVGVPVIVWAIRPRAAPGRVRS